MPETGISEVLGTGVSEVPGTGDNSATNKTIHNSTYEAYLLKA